MVKEKKKHDGMKLLIKLNVRLCFFSHYNDVFIINYVCIFEHKGNEHSVKLVFLNCVFVELQDERWLVITQ